MRSRLICSRILTNGVASYGLFTFLFLLCVLIIKGPFTIPLNSRFMGQGDVEMKVLELNEVQLLPFSRARVDNMRIIKFYDWMWIAQKWDWLKANFDVCLSTQGSMNRIHQILEVVENWQGPISLAVFITSEAEWIGLNLLVNHFKKCSPMFRDFVSIHIALPSSLEQFHKSTIHGFSKDFSCEQSEEFVQQVVGKYHSSDKTESLALYPQNHMRNFARKGCGTDWVFSTDIDIIPRAESAKLLQEFYNSEEAKNCKKCAFVIPTFELNTTLSFPWSKKELLQYWKAGQARPFHFNVFKAGHTATNYLTWSKTHLEEEPIKISHNASKKDTGYYEPFYISSDTIPAFSERFIGYGFTRSSQVQEALIEGWTFKVLTPIFVIHWGMQKISTLISPQNQWNIRKEQTTNNQKIFRLFLKELKFKKSLT